MSVTEFGRALGDGLVPARCGFFFDFDGTLAPIQPDPVTVEPVPGVVRRVHALAQVAGLVALVSARPVEFLASRFVPANGVQFFGLYGLESVGPGGELQTHPAAVPYVDTIAALTDRARLELPPGTSVEPKRLTVALHFRNAPAAGAEVEEWAQARAAEHGLTVQPGRMVVELKPPHSPTKGTVVTEHTDGLRFVWYFGDDVGDIAAFTALRELEARVPGFRAMLVAVHNPETGRDLVPLADEVLASPHEVPALLDGVLRLLT